MSRELLEELSKRYGPLLTQSQYYELTGKAKSTAEQDRLYGHGAPFICMGRSPVVETLPGKDASALKNVRKAMMKLWCNHKTNKGRKE